MIELGTTYKNFAVGPVMMDSQTMKLGGESIPYFRTDEFSMLMKENETMLCDLANAPFGSKAVFITGSGTAAMEAAVCNFYTPQDKVLVVNGGSFGDRFVQLCALHNIPYTEIRLAAGKSLTETQLLQYENDGYTGLLVQHCETSTGLLYNMTIIASFCNRNNLFLTVDCISSFLAEQVDMARWNAGALIIGSQKALALPPGISAIIMNETAQKRIARRGKPVCMYLDLQIYLKDMERGQTPFTPAISVLMQLYEKLERILQNGGYQASVSNVAQRATYFRSLIQTLPFDVFPDVPAHALTALAMKGAIDARALFSILKNEHRIFLCPNGGALSSKLIRVGHIGNITMQDIDFLVAALHKVTKHMR